MTPSLNNKNPKYHDHSISLNTNQTHLAADQARVQGQAGGPSMQKEVNCTYILGEIVKLSIYGLNSCVAEALNDSIDCNNNN